MGVPSSHHWALLNHIAPGSLIVVSLSGLPSEERPRLTRHLARVASRHRCCIVGTDPVLAIRQQVPVPPAICVGRHGSFLPSYEWGDVCRDPDHKEFDGLVAAERPEPVDVHSRVDGEDVIVEFDDDARRRARDLLATAHTLGHHARLIGDRGVRIGPPVAATLGGAIQRLHRKQPALHAVVVVWCDQRSTDLWLLDGVLSLRGDGVVVVAIAVAAAGTAADPVAEIADTVVENVEQLVTLLDLLVPAAQPHRLRRRGTRVRRVRPSRAGRTP